MSLQKRLLSSESNITLSLLVLPNSLNNLSVFMRDAILLIFTAAALTFFLSMYHRLVEFFLNHIWSLSPLSLTVPFPLHCILPFHLSSLIFHHLQGMNKCDMFSAAAHSHVLVQPRTLVLLALLIDLTYSHCIQLFSSYSPELPLCYFFIPISFLFLRFLCL